jgi:transposase
LITCRVIDAFVERLALSELGFERAQAADTGRPGCDPRDFLKLYLYGYLNQIRSSRRLEAECRRNVELMWLLGRLYPDHKSISEFRRMHSEAVTAAGAALIRFAQSCGLIPGEWIAIDGSKFRAVASVDSTRERLDLQRYLESIKKLDEEQQANINQSAVQAAVERLNRTVSSVRYISTFLRPFAEKSFVTTSNGSARTSTNTRSRPGSTTPNSPPCKR